MPNNLNRLSQYQVLPFFLVSLILCTYLLPSNSVAYLLMLCCSGIIMGRSMLKDARLLASVFIFWIYILFSTLLAHSSGIDVVLAIKYVFLSLFFVSSLAVNRRDVFSPPNTATLLFMQKLILSICMLLLLSQFFLIFKIAPFYDFILNQYMTNEVFASLYKGDMNIGTERSGGIYINPNQLAKAYSFLLVMAAVTYLAEKKNSQFFFYLTFFIVSLGIFVSGSRTGLIVIFFVFILWNVQGITLVRMLSFIVIVVLLIFVQLNLSDSRIFSTDSSALNSLFYKLKFAFLYIDTSSSLELTFGHGLFSYKEVIESLSVGALNFGFDADIGYSLFHFGVIGTIAIICYLFAVRVKYNIPIYVYGIFPWVMTSSLFFNIRNISMLIIMFLVLNLKKSWERQ